MAKIFEFVHSNEKIESLSMEVPEDMTVQAAIIKSLDAERRISVSHLKHIRLVSQKKEKLLLFEKYLKRVK